MAYSGYIPGLLQVAANATTQGASPTPITNGIFRDAEVYFTNPLMNMQRRSPMTFEWVDSIDSNNNPTWKTITIYINPNKISFQQNKVVGKAYTRGGIFFQMWGEDVGSLTLSGYTGLSGMAGIAQIEEFWHASNTLLAYQPSGINYMSNVNVPTFDSMNFQSPLDAVTAATNSTNLDYIASAQQTISDFINGTPVNMLGDISSATLTLYTNRTLSQAEMADDITNAVNSLYTWQQSYMNVNSTYPSRAVFFQQAVQYFSENLPAVSSDIISNLAYETAVDFYTNNIPVNMISNNIVNSITLQQVGVSYTGNGTSNTSTIDTSNQYYEYQIAFNPVQNDTQAIVLTESNNSISALQTLLGDLQTWYQNEQTAMSQLQMDIISTQFVDFFNKWEPRRVIIYFEDRAWVGFFQTFQYDRDGGTNLVSYSLQFTVQYQFTIGNNPNALASSSTTSTSTSTPTTTTPTAATPTAATQPTMWHLANKYGKIVSGTNYNQIVNQNGGQWLNHQWVPGRYNTQGEFIRSPGTGY